jgi:pimeloyl-ACP methyl ester carboxylesterase
MLTNEQPPTVMAFVYDASKYAWSLGKSSVSSGMYNPFSFGARQTKNFTLDAVVSMYKPRSAMPNDSFLCDEQVMAIANREGVYERAYSSQAASVLGRWRNAEDLLVAVDPIFPSVAFVRGTIGAPDIATDVVQFTSGGMAPIASMYIAKLKDFLAKNTSVTTVIGHSLGGHVTNAATFDMPGVTTVGLDAARILDIQYAYYQKSSWFESPSKTTNRVLQYAYTRNINSNSWFDRLLDHYGPPEMAQPNPDPTYIGHTAYMFEYLDHYKRYKDTYPDMATGFGDGVVRQGLRLQPV